MVHRVVWTQLDCSLQATFRFSESSHFPKAYSDLETERRCLVHHRLWYSIGYRDHSVALILFVQCYEKVRERSAMTGIKAEK